MDFRLLIKGHGGTSRPTITLEGESWSLTDSLNIHSDKIPEYACVSYVWGQGRENNPIHSSILMSDRTLVVLSAAIRNTSHNAFWVDAFCVPTDPLRKGSTLESMGYIYARVAKVIAVLTPKSFAAVKKMSSLRREDTPSAQLLNDLEQESWIRSVWTYQEVVNSSCTFFAGDDSSGGDLLDVSAFLNSLGYYLLKFRDAHRMTAFELRQRYPSLDTFEDLALDYMLAAYAERSALQIMSNMARRYYDDPKNYFYSMIGALTQKPSKRSRNPSVEELADTFMVIAEEKGDFSFIFSSAPRDERPGLEWRPRPQILGAVVNWHVDGEILAGAKDHSGITLQDIVVTCPAEAVGPAGREKMLAWLNVPELEHASDSVIASKLRGVFESIDFMGNGSLILTEQGYVFPWEDIPRGASVEIWLTTGISYRFGAPAMVVAHVGNVTKYIPGLFGGTTKGSGVCNVFIPTSAARL